MKVSLKTLINNLDRGFQGSRAEKSGPYSENAFIRIELWKKQAGSGPKKSFVSSLLVTSCKEAALFSLNFRCPLKFPHGRTLCSYASVQTAVASEVWELHVLLQHQCLGLITPQS